MDEEDELVPLAAVKEPLDLIRISVDERIFVKMKNGRRLKGKLHAYDQHLNMVLEEVEETVINVDIDEETYEETCTERKRRIPLMFLRGDGVVLLSPIRRSDV